MTILHQTFRLVSTLSGSSSHVTLHCVCNYVPVGKTDRHDENKENDYVCAFFLHCEVFIRHLRLTTWNDDTHACHFSKGHMQDSMEIATTPAL